MNVRPLVIHMIDELPPNGAERLIVDVLARRSDQFDYRVLCLVRGGELQKDIEALGIPVDIMDKRLGFDWRLIPRLLRYLKRHDPAVVHTHLFTADFWGRLAAWLAGVPAIFSTSHSENNWKSALHRLLDRWMAAVSTRVIACTDRVETVLIERDRIPAKRISVIANGIDLERFAPANRCNLEAEFGISPASCTLAIIGRFHPVKGHLYFLGVFAELLKQVDAHLLLVGDGELRPAIEQKITELRLDDAVTLAGFRRDVPAILNSLDIVALPSELEGLPMVVLEAMARGKSVVAHDVGGIADVISDQTLGRVVEPNNAAQMLATLIELCSSSETRRSIGANAERLIRGKFNAASTSAAYEALYKDAIG